MKVKWRKGWEVVDEAKGGYTETAYECFDIVPDIPLLKSKAGEIWHIGNLRKGEKPSLDRLFLMSRKREKSLTE